MEHKIIIEIKLKYEKPKVEKVDGINITSLVQPILEKVFETLNKNSKEKVEKPEKEVKKTKKEGKK